MYQKVIAWQKSMELVPVIYDLTNLFPETEKFGLFSQMRRCVVSIPSNIAEGKMRGSRKEYLRFLNIALASGAELKTQLQIVKAVNYHQNRFYLPATMLLDEVMRLLYSIISTLQNQVKQGLE